MGSNLSRLNNKVTFDYAEYIRERNEVSQALRDIVRTAKDRRKRTSAVQVVAGASSIASGIAGGVVAVAAAPVSFGLSLPAATAATVAIVGNSLAAASVTSSAASFGHGYIVDKDISRQLQNLQCMVNSMSRKDEEVHALIQCLSSEIITPNIAGVREKLDKKIAFDEGTKANSRTAWSVLSPGTFSLLNGKTKFESEQDFELELSIVADTIDRNTEILRSLEHEFKYFSCIPNERQLSRGRLTYVDSGGGCTRTMEVKFLNPHQDSCSKLKSDSTGVIRLPEGATNVEVSFQVKGGGAVMKVDRSNPKQPWVKCKDGKRQVDVFEFEHGDGVDAVFCVKGPLTHSYVHKAWDFGRHPATEPRVWELWEGNPDGEWAEVLPDSNRRVLRRTREEQGQQPLIGLSCPCFCQGVVTEQVA